MSGALLTKRMIAEEFKKLMEEKTLTKITVSELLDRCKMNRQNFYYHFKDKYDLVNWIFYDEFYRDFESRDFNDKWEELYAISMYFEEHREFYLKVLEYNGQNSFMEYFQSIVLSIANRDLTSNVSKGSQTEFINIFLADAVCATFNRWIKEGNQISAKEFTNNIIYAIKVVNDVIDHQDIMERMK